jgi:hypothetical protein
MRPVTNPNGDSPATSGSARHIPRLNVAAVKTISVVMTICCQPAKALGSDKMSGQMIEPCAETSSSLRQPQMTVARKG